MGMDYGANGMGLIIVGPIKFIFDDLILHIFFIILQGLPIQQQSKITFHSSKIPINTKICPYLAYNPSFPCSLPFAAYNRLMQKENPQENTFSIQFQEWTTLQSLISKHASAVLPKSFWKRREKELSQFIYVFRVNHEGERWMLRRTFADLFSFEKAMTKRYGKDIPLFPMQREHEITIDNIDKVGEFLIFFLKKVVNTAFYDPEVQTFLDILPDKFGHGIIFGEFPLRKLSGGRYNEKSYCKSLRHCLCPCARTWRTRFFTVTDNGVFYSKARRSFEVRDMLIYCNRFKMFVGSQETDDELGITLKSSQRELALIAPDVCTFVLFVTAMREALESSPLTKQHPFGSFSPARSNCSTVFYADGDGYFKDLYLQLKNAKKYIYITDWMITPYFMLIRKKSQDGKEELKDQGLQFRLDKVLEEAAGRGVAIYILLYQEPKVAINNDSQYAEKYLSRLHRNIKVLRHPNYLVIPFFWSHHEKLVLIDQRIAFIGGLDICYGRWDTPQHHLTNDYNLWSGADFCNLRITDIYFPRNFMMCSLDPRTQPRMPWHDVAIQLRGPSVHDLARHFTGYWNFVTSQMDMDDQELLTISGRQTYHFHQTEESRDNRVLPMMDKRKNTNDVESELVDNLIEQEYYEKYLNQSMLRVGSLQIPRMHVIRENLRAMPRKLMELITETRDQKQCLLVANEIEEHKQGRYKHQFLRSAATWSQGLMQKEQSIYQAYLHLISTAEHFIYIENQFFICKENLIVQKLAERISKAHAAKKPFKVVVFIPLLPGFQGDVREEKSAVMRIQLYWEYWTICRSSKSLYKRLAHIKNIDDYLQFYSLRQHGSTQEKLPLTQILYIHSKLIIADDKRLIIGSANINDRSMLGERDSEIALFVEEQQPQPSPFGWDISPGIQDFRVRLYEEHFGNTNGRSLNPLDEQLWVECRERAKTNTLIYRQVFGCYPDDTMRNFGQIEQVYQRSKIQNYFQRKEQIIGHVVELPLRFLEEENLNLSAKEKEYFLPNIFFT